MESYLGHYGLARPPFDAAVDARFLYSGRSYCAVRDEITQALRHQEGLILLVGESGTGKTTLCRSLLQTVEPAPFLSFITDPFLTLEDLLKQVLNDFGVLTEQARQGGSGGRITCHDLVLAVQRFVESLDAAHARAVIAIDDAHQLDAAVLLQLRALSNLETATVRLQLILVGQPSLDVMLQQPSLRQLRQRVARRCVIQPLSNAETRQYLDHRLTAASETLPEAPPADALMTSRAVATLASVARGVPRTVDLLGDRALQVGYEHRATRIDGPMVLEAAQRLDVPIPVTARFRCVQPATAAAGVALVIVLFLTSLWGSGRIRIAWPGASRGPTPIASPGLPVATAQTAVSATGASAATSGGEPTLTRALQAADSYLVVAASFETAQHADEAIGRLIALDLPAFKREADDGRWHVVLIGPYASADEANEVRKQIELTDFVGARVMRQAATAFAKP